MGNFFNLKKLGGKNFDFFISNFLEKGAEFLRYVCAGLRISGVYGISEKIWRFH